METRQRNKSTNKDICKVCKADISNDQMIQCDRCEDWLCRKCAGLNAEALEIFSKYPDTMTWFCQDCKLSALKAVKSDNLIEDRCKAHFDSLKKELDTILNKKFEEADSSIKSVEDKMRKEDQSIREEIAKLKVDLEQKIEKVTGEVTTKSVQEVNERRSRAGNAILFKLKESPLPDPELRKAEDIQLAKKLCNILQVQAEITQAMRIGKKEGDRIRPLKLTLQNSQQAENLIRASRKLSNCKEKDFEQVVIKNDMTPMEREELKTLLKIRDQKREESRIKGEAVNWIVRGGKVIKGKPPAAAGGATAAEGEAT